MPVFGKYDVAKSMATKADRGIDFEDAKRVWNDPAALTAGARTEDEERFAIIGKLEDGHLYTVIYTEREDGLRIISVRRAKPREAILYG